MMDVVHCASEGRREKKRAADCRGRRRNALAPIGRQPLLSPHSPLCGWCLPHVLPLQKAFLVLGMLTCGGEWREREAERERETDEGG